MRSRERKLMAVIGLVVVAAGLGMTFLFGAGSQATSKPEHARHWGTLAQVASAPRPSSSAAEAVTTTCGTLPHGPSEIDSVPSCLAAQFPNDYAGVYQTSEVAMTIVEVYRTPTLEAAATSGLAPYEVSFATVAYSYAQLQQVRNVITLVRSTLQAGGIEILSLCVNTESNQVTVGVTKAETVAAVGQYLGSHFGEGMITARPAAIENAEPARR